MKSEVSVATRITDSCEKPNIGTGKWTQLLLTEAIQAPILYSQGVSFLCNAWILEEGLIAHLYVTLKWLVFISCLQ